MRKVRTMELGLLFQIVSTTIMVIGVIFGIQNIRQYQANRKRESAILMLNSFQTPDFVRGLLSIFNLPDHAGKDVVDGLPAEEFMAIYMVMGAWERLGVLVFRGEIPLHLVDDAFSGPIVQSWQKLDAYVSEFRAQIGRDTFMEWYQWLAERMLEREQAAGPVPAYLAHRDWKARR